MGRKGRPKGQQSKSCLIKDDRITPFEVHVDKYNYILVNGETQQSDMFQQGVMETYTQSKNTLMLCSNCRRAWQNY